MFFGLSLMEVQQETEIMFRNMRIGLRLGIGFGLVLLIFTLVCFFTINRLDFMSDLTDKMYRHPFTVSSAVERVETNIAKIHRSMKDVALARNDAEIAVDSQLVEQYEKDIYKDFETIAERFLGHREMYEDAIEAYKNWKPIRDEVMALMLQGKRAEAADITRGKGARHVEELTKSMAVLHNFALDKAESFHNDALDTRATTLKTVYVLLGAAILARVIFTIVFTRSITRPLSELVDTAVSISQGNLDEDISAKSEDEIGHLAAALDEMTSKLKEYQEQLVRQEKLAILGQLAGGVGHELRNPLGVISNAVYYLQMVLPDADDNVKEYLDIISSEVGNSEKIITDLLDFARIKSLERVEITVEDAIAHVLERQPPPEGVEVVTHIPSELPPIFVDVQQIEGQVLSNLMGNACQAMPEGGKLTISAQEAGDKVRISVSDTGCGISEDNLKKIFEPLFTTRAKGIGLGLAVTENLVEANGGSIAVESTEGEGSTFTIILPTKKGVA